VRRGIAQDGVQNGRVVAEGLARCGRRGDYDVAASQRMFYRNRLMRVELRDAAGTEHVAQWFADTVRK
jgi:hypothetical protein